MWGILLGIVEILACAAEPKVIHPASWLGDIACADSLAFLGTTEKVLALSLPHGQVIAELPFPGPAQALAWDGHFLAAGGWNTLRIWSWPEKTLYWEDTGFSTMVRSLAFTNDGLLLGGGANGFVFTWDPKEKRRLWSFQAHTSSIWGIAASPKAPIFATASSDRLAIWDLYTHRELQNFPGRTWDVAFSPDGFLLAAGMGKILKVWDTAFWLLVWEAWAHESCTVTVAFSADGSYLATGSLDQTAKVWDVQAGKVLFVSSPFPAILAAVRFSPTGLLLAGSEDGTLLLWQP